MREYQIKLKKRQLDKDTLPPLGEYVAVFPQAHREKARLCSGRIIKITTYPMWRVGRIMIAKERIWWTRYCGLIQAGELYWEFKGDPFVGRINNSYVPVLVQRGDLWRWSKMRSTLKPDSRV